MSFRTVVITRRCKLDLCMNYMEVRHADGKKRIFLDEIGILILENPAIALTGCLLSELMRKKIKVIFCDAKHNPQGELVTYGGSYDGSRKLRQQIAWTEDIKGAVWTCIVTEKIRQQAGFLRELKKEREAEMLFGYVDAILYRDTSNREGHAAKVYFNALFGMDFTRDSSCPINAALNYGYAMVLSLINREVAASGYLAQLGLFHDNVFNPFNLSCDLIEPFRILVDRFVYQAGFQEFGTEEKHQMLKLFQQEVRMQETRQQLSNAVPMYVQSVFRALNEGDSSLIRFYCHELSVHADSRLL